jgi:hypothetical protein
MSIPIYPKLKMDIWVWKYRKSEIFEFWSMVISDFRYIQTDMFIFSYGYIGMDISEIIIFRLKSQFPIYPDRYVHFVAMAVSEIRYGYIGIPI